MPQKHHDLLHCTARSTETNTELMQKLMVLRYNPDGIKYARNKILFENFIAQWRCRLYLRSKTSLFIFFMFNLFIKNGEQFVFIG
jgi:hypothetical protein